MSLALDNLRFISMVQMRTRNRSYTLAQWEELLVAAQDLVVALDGGDCEAPEMSNPRNINSCHRWPAPPKNSGIGGYFIDPSKDVCDNLEK